MEEQPHEVPLLNKIEQQHISGMHYYPKKSVSGINDSQNSILQASGDPFETTRMTSQRNNNTIVTENASLLSLIPKQQRMTVNINMQKGNGHLVKQDTYGGQTQHRVNNHATSRIDYRNNNISMQLLSNHPHVT